jgi:hypothetical protein
MALSVLYTEMYECLNSKEVSYVRLPQVASTLSPKTRRKYIRVALATASLLSTVLKNKVETTRNLQLVNSHIKLS